MANPVIVGATVGTVIMPGAGTVIGAATGGLVSLFSGPEAQQQQASIGGRTIDARQIWEQIHNGSSDSLHDGASAASSLQSVHDERSSQIDAINQAMDAAWQGDASLQVQAGAHPLGIWLRDSASNLTKSSTYLTSQGESFDTAQSKVQEIAATPPHAGFMDHVNPFSDKDDEINKYNEQGQTNVQAFNAYYQASAQNAAGMPQYSAWQGNTFSGGNGKDKTDHTKEPTDRTSTLPSNPGGYQPGGTGSIPGGSTGSIPGSGTNLPGTGTGGVGTGSGSGTGSGGAYDPSNIGSGSSGYKSPSWNDGTAAAGYTPSTSSTDFGPSGSGYSGIGSGSGSGSGAGGGYGVGGVGSIGAGGFGPGGSSSLSSGASTGAGAGSAAGGAAGVGRGAVGAGVSGRAGSSGMSGMGHGGKGGKGGDDDEHETKYLVSEDPNDLFGTDELTAPPVIGE